MCLERSERNEAYYEDDAFSFDKEITSDITLSAKWGKITTVPSNNGKKVVYGDVNEDGVVDEKDSLRLLKYLEELETLTDQGKKNADINNDGKIDKRDSVLFLGYLGHYYENTLPNKPITDYVLYGDVNEDGIVDGKDSIRLLKYLENNEPLTDQAKKNADINNDRKLDKVDSVLLLAYLGHYYNSTLPYMPIKDYVIYGDINEDGNVDLTDTMKLSKLLNDKSELTKQQKKNADVNNDGKVDYVDVAIISKYIVYSTNSKIVLTPIKDYVLYGDINEDGKVSYADLLLLEKYLNNQTKLSNQALKNADINNDKKVNKVDSLQLAKHLANWEGYTILPNSPITNYVDYGDVNEDGIIDEKDAILLKKYLENNESLTNQGKKNADINKDGKVDKNDYDYLIDKVNLKNNLEANNTYGDIDENNKITYADLVLLAKYLEGESNLSEQAKKNADVNKDGKVDSEDLNVLAKYLANWEGYSKLPVTN